MSIVAIFLLLMCIHILNNKTLIILKLNLPIFYSIFYFIRCSIQYEIQVQFRWWKWVHHPIGPRTELYKIINTNVKTNINISFKTQFRWSSVKFFFTIYTNIPPFLEVSLYTTENYRVITSLTYQLE